MLILKNLARAKGCTQEDIARILNTQQSEVSKMMNGLREISDEQIEVLCNHFGREVVHSFMSENGDVTMPEIKIDFRRLMFDKRIGQGELGKVLNLVQSQVSLLVNGRRDTTQAHVEMLIEHFGAETIAKYTISEDAMNMVTRPIAKQTEATIVPASVVEEAKAEAIEEYKAEESIVIVPVEIANAPQKDIKEYIESKGDELESIVPSDLVKPANGAERVRKNSMSPTFSPSDIVFFKTLDDVRNITDGNIYYFKIKNRPTMLRRVKIEGEKLRLIAENPNFGDMVITFSDIINVADIVGMFRSSFGNQYAEIEAVRRKKDSQIDKLIKQNGDALKSISDLISVIKNK